MSQIDHILPAGADPPRRLDHFTALWILCWVKLCSVQLC
jgi:hypothetical protein